MLTPLPIFAEGNVSLQIRGENYEIETLQKGVKPFINRSNISFSDIPAEYEGWKFVRINANSTYLPGPAANIEVKAEQDGDLIVMAEVTENPAISEAWINDNGWELIEGPTLPYGTNPHQTLTFYRKAVKAGEWVKVVQLTTFSGTIVIAPSIKEEEVKPEMSFVIRGENYEIDNLQKGAKPFINRSNVSFNDIPAEYEGWKFVRINANSTYLPGPAANIEVKAEQDGELIVMAEVTENPAVSEAWINDNGWELIEGPTLPYGTNDHQTLTFYRKTVKAGEWVKVVQLTTFSGTIVIAPSIKEEEVKPEMSFLVRGENYEIETLQKGAKPFINRSNISFSDIPAEYEGWKFVKINANSTYLPGPAANIEVKAEQDGELIVMAEVTENPAVSEAWIKDNGWELIEGPTLPYGTNPHQTLTFYRKAIKAGEWVKVVQLTTFSGAIVIAPSIKEEEGVTVNAIPVNIIADGVVEVATFQSGEPIYSNRSYILCNVPKELKGLQFTRYNGGGIPTIDVIAKEAGTAYIAVSVAETQFKPEDQGWTKVEDLGFYYNDGTSTAFNIYKKDMEKDEKVNISTTDWYGVLILAPSIDIEKTFSITPPPGIVIRNSPASSGKFVGSPSIVRLEDGTYLASHDIFGGVISYTYVYKSTDKGRTWEELCMIDKLTWSKLFSHGDDVYLIGIQPRCTMGYGNVVILRSSDKGKTWTQPTDSKNGFLKEGFYHTAPTPIVKHNGRIWKAYENQGSEWGWGPFASLMLSVDENNDLLNADSWTFSNELTHVAGTIPSNAWLEGNAVVAPDGSIKNILRLDYANDDKAAIVSVSEDGKTVSYDPMKDISNLPGACKKFTIHYDETSKRYWTLSNYALSEDRGKVGVGDVRNTIVLAWSEDLIEWTIKDTLLHHADVANHGFQYLDWEIEGNDIIAVSRTAWEDETGVARRAHDANYLTFHRFANFRYERATSRDGIRVAKWMNNAKSAFALTFDDGFKAHYDYVYPMLEKYDIKGTFYVNSANLVKKGQSPKERYGFEEEFAEISNAGHEIGSHSLNHLNLTELDMATLRKELGEDKANIERFTGKPCLTHAYPFTLHNDQVDKVMADYFIAGRAGGIATNNVPKDQNRWYSTKSELLTWIYPRSLENEQTSYEKLKTTIDKLSSRFGVVCIHETLPFDLLNTSNTYEVATTEWLEKTCAYLAEQREEGKMWPTTLANIVRYSLERANLRVIKQEVSEEEIQYNFTTLLDTTIYNVPLTVDLTLPTDWGRARCQVVVDGNITSDKVYTVSSSMPLTINIVPDKESLIITKISNSQEIEYTLPSEGISTIILPFNSEIPDGVTVYECIGFSEDCVSLEQKTTITENTPYIIQGIPGTYIFSGTVNGAQDLSYSNSYMTGVYVETTAPISSYVMQGLSDTGSASFYKVTDESVKVPLYHCYLNATESSYNEYKIPEEITAIEDVKVTPDAIVDVYTTNGQIIRRNVKSADAFKGLGAGIYVIKNKKILVR